MFLTCTFVCACVRASVPCRRHSLTYLPPASHCDQTAELKLTSYRCRVSEMMSPADASSVHRSAVHMWLSSRQPACL